jgi:hypothetical protein
MDYKDLIDRERRRRSILVQKLDESDRRIATLISMSARSDPLDLWLDQQVDSSPGPSPEPPAPTTAAPMMPLSDTDAAPARSRVTRDTPRKISAQWLDLIEYLGEDGKDLTQVTDFLGRAGAQMTTGAIRTGLMNYRKDYGLVLNPKPGFYAATQKGLAFVRSRRLEGSEAKDELVSTTN